MLRKFLHFYVFENSAKKFVWIFRLQSVYIRSIEWVLVTDSSV
jgi:hypothetical protein